MSLYLNNGFGKTLDILHRTMGANLLRQEVIANNIANADTPNFKRSVVDFESGLKRALASENAPQFPTKMTDEKHIPFDRPTDYRTVQPRRITEWLVTGKNNGNNVDIEEETSNAVNQQLAYNLMVQTVTGQFNNVNLVLRG